MFDTLTRGFRSVRLRLQGRAVITEENIEEALAEVRRSLLDADVELGVVKGFLDRVRSRAVGEVVPLRSRRGAGGVQVTPGDHFVRICHDELVALMGGEGGRLDLEGRPAVIMVVGLQGSGKTTTAGKIARRLLKEGHRPMLVAADVYRPAAVDQLATLGRKLGVPVFSIKGMEPVQLCSLAITQARNVGRDVVILDTAGRLAIDERLMEELERIREATRPRNVLFVADAMIGQDAVRTAAEFDRRLDFTGFVLTKLDGDARGGAALSIRQVTGKPVVFLGTGEGLDELEDFRPDGLASRILGMGDIVGLVKDLEEHVSEEEAEADARKILEGRFTFDDFLKQLGTLQKLGPMRTILERMPGFSDLLDRLPPEALDERELVKVRAMIQSMTRQERRQPELLHDVRRVRRVARGSGRPEQEVRDLLERFLQARELFAAMGRGGLPGLGGGFPGLGFPGLGGGMPGMGAGASAGGRRGGRPALSAEEKIARRRKARAARKARKKQRRR